MDVSDALLTTVFDHCNSPRLFPMKGAKKPEYWQFIELIAQPNHNNIPSHQLVSLHAEAAFCKKCGCKIYYSCGSTLEVHNHMHSKRQDDVKKFRDQNKNNQKKNQLPEGDATEEARPVKRRAVTMTEGQQRQCNERMAIWIAQSMRPFSSIEDPGLIDFIRYVARDIGGFDLRVPTRAEIRREIVALAADLRTTLMASLRQTCHTYSLTTDMWTDRAMRSFICLTMHFVDNDFDQHNWVLEVEGFHGKHDGAKIATTPETAMERWGLDQSMCAMLVRDGAPNAVSAANRIGMEHMYCIAHSLHLVVSAAMIHRQSKRETSRKGATSDAVEPQMSANIVSGPCNGALFTTVPKTRHTRLCGRGSVSRLEGREDDLRTWR